MGARGRLQRQAVDGLREQRERLDTEAHGQQVYATTTMNGSKRCAALGTRRPQCSGGTVRASPSPAAPRRAPQCCTPLYIACRLGRAAQAQRHCIDLTECSASHACRSTHSNSPTASRRTCAAHHSCGPTCGSGESRRRCGRVSPENGTEAAESGRDVAAVSAVPWNARRCAAQARLRKPNESVAL